MIHNVNGVTHVADRKNDARSHPVLWEADVGGAKYLKVIFYEYCRTHLGRQNFTSFGYGR